MRQFAIELGFSALFGMIEGVCLAGAAIPTGAFCVFMAPYISDKHWHIMTIGLILLTIIPVHIVLKKALDSTHPNPYLP